MKNITIILLILISIMYCSSCIVTNKQFISLEKKINNNKRDTIFYKNLILVNNKNKVNIEKYKNGKKNGKSMCISKTANGKIGEYSVVRYKNGIIKGAIKVYSGNGKLLRKIRTKNGHALNIVSPSF